MVGLVGKRRERRGLVLPMVLVVGAILLMLGLTLFQFVGQQNANLHLLANAEVAHFMAEAGISSCIRSIREALSTAGITDGSNTKLNALLTLPQPLPDTSLMPFLKDIWNEDLKKFSKEVDKTANIRVEVWLRGFESTETDPKAWVDPGAKQGWLSIEATGEYRGMKRVLSIKRKVWVGNTIPPLVSKFTLYVRKAGAGSPGQYNVVRNDYGGNVTDEAKPLMCFNHTTPEAIFPFQPGAISSILGDEKDPFVYQKRGWIWLGGGPVRLNITSGSGAFGEIFHFYDISTSNSFQAIKFRTPVTKLPPVFGSPQQLPGDDIDPDNPQNLKYSTYSFGHNFVIEGFHDISDRKQHDAMYERDILSRPHELPRFGSKSSQFHLFGLAQKGFQSRTKVIGEVTAAFPRFASLEVKPEEPVMEQKFLDMKPPPLYLLPSLHGENYTSEYHLKDFLGRHFGGPILATGFFFADQADYAKYMSCIVEVPYIISYNSMQDTNAATGIRQFPPSSSTLTLDTGSNLILKNQVVTLYEGPVDNPRLLEVMSSRIQREIGTIQEFWDRYFDKKTQTLQLNEIVRIRNPQKQTFFLPPNTIAYPLKVAGGGLIMLEEGNLVLREVVMNDVSENLTVALVKGTSVQFETPKRNQVNIVAPNAELAPGFAANLFGSLCLHAVPPNSRSPGGNLYYREDQDPTQNGYFSFYKVRIDDKDTFWHE
jgi:hypothetical protein